MNCPICGNNVELVESGIMFVVEDGEDQGNLGRDRDTDFWVCNDTVQKYKCMSDDTHIFFVKAKLCVGGCD